MHPLLRGQSMPLGPQHSGMAEDTQKSNIIRKACTSMQYCHHRVAFAPRIREHRMNTLERAVYLCLQSSKQQKNRL